jgi:DNA repair protein RadC
MSTVDLWAVSEVKLTYQCRIPKSQRPNVSTSQDAFNIFWTNWSPDIELCEEFLMLILNQRNDVIGMGKVSQGGLAGTVVDMRILFSLAITSLASAIILGHNHPSGNIKPSNSDIKLTEKIKASGEVLDIRILDHLILSPDKSYFSFADEGLMT